MSASVCRAQPSRRRGTPQNLIIAASAMAAIPTIVFFLIFQRNIMAGLTAGGIRGWPTAQPVRRLASVAASCPDRQAENARPFIRFRPGMNTAYRVSSADRRRAT
jgi:hypothetical protein